MEPVAIVGMSCRFPGANSPEAFWSLLRDGVRAIGDVPAERWDIDDYYRPAQQPGKMNTRRGGFISGADEFEPGFFGISPREAMHMDPQQRLMLEVAWEALERSGTVPAQLAGSPTGVFIGCGNYDFGIRMAREYEDFDAYLGTGATVGMIANRLSYLLDLRGPSLTVETACSSSLVAIHLACQSLLSGETDLCMVGASSLMQAPNQTIIYSQAQMMSPEGACKTFDVKADGYVRGEGCGLVVLKRLVDAQKAGDRILAVIKGTAVNQDGLSNGLTAPNGPAQQAVIRQALLQAEVRPEQISYIEAHGTGTPLGDPIEIKSLKAVLNENRRRDYPCWIGSVKTNIGHLEAAAGMAGLIKTVLALQHKEIPPHLNLDELNPYISLEGTPFSIPTEPQTWETPCSTRLAGISSFGFGGTNAHLIVEEAVLTQSAAPDEDETAWPKVFKRSQHLLTLSAKSDLALSSLVSRYEEFLHEQPGVALANVCASASQQRSHFTHRLSLVAASTQDLYEQLQQIQHGQYPTGSTCHTLIRKKPPKIAFLFTGQGSQYIDMGRQLYESQPTFRATLERCDEMLRPLIGKSLLKVLYPDSAESNTASQLLNQTSITQPALFALEYALAQLWQSWGIQPEVVMGHSVGEYVAACVAGVFSLEDGLNLVAARGRLMQALPETGPQAGKMVAVLASVEQIEIAIAPYQSQVSIAAINGPTSLTLSGRSEAVDSLCKQLEKEGIKTKLLTVSHAFHSPLMKPILADFRSVAEQVTFYAPQLKFVSNLTGSLADKEVTTPSYWCDHVVEPVNFAKGIATLRHQKCPIWLEVGANPILSSMAQRAFFEEPTEFSNKNPLPSCLPSLRANRENWSQILETLGALYARGAQVDWVKFEESYDHRFVLLPTYPWQRQRYWINPTDRPRANLSPVVSLLNEGKVQELAQQVQATSHFSEAEIALLPKLIKSLVQQHSLSSQTASLRPDTLYELVWRCKPRSPVEETSAEVSKEASSWLILADRGGVGAVLGDLLEQQGHRYRLLYADEILEEQAGRSRVLQQAISTVLQNGISPVSSVVLLWGLDAATSEDPLSYCATLRQDTLSTVKILADQAAVLNLKLWLVTQKASSLSLSRSGLFSAPLWGLGKVVSLEHPNIWGGMIDWDGGSERQAVARLADELLNSQGEDQIAFYNEQRYVLRLTPQTERIQPAQAAAEKFAISGEATYLITGGLGALGLAVATWLVKHGARHLVLIGRQSPSWLAAQAITTLTAAGAAILPMSADVTDKSDMTAVFEKIKDTLPPLKGIVHAAGMASYDAVKEITAEQLEQVLAPKVNGSWILHQLCESLDLNFFVSFSSIASVWGSKGQAHYAAANQFLDSLAHYRQQQGLPALTVNWGPWAGGGMVVDDFEAWLARAGITPLIAEQATAALGHLLAQQQTQATVVDIEWSRFKALYNLRKQSPLLQEIATSAVATSISSKALEDLKATPPAQRQEKLTAFVQSEVASIMELPTGQRPDLYQGFFEMGMDSLMAIELKTQLERTLACTLPSTLIFEMPTIYDLSRYLAKEILGWPLKDVVNQEERETKLSSSTPLSEGEIEASIEQQLAKIESLIGGKLS